MKDWRIQHGEEIKHFVHYLKSISNDYILKGGTALALCYGLDRFSEDIDLDAKNKGIIPIIEAYCIKNKYSLRVSKDTHIGERCFINYGNDERPLKIETSHRRKDIPADELNIVNGILTYKIDPLCIMKTNAYLNRDRTRSLRLYN